MDQNRETHQRHANSWKPLTQRFFLGLFSQGVFGLNPSGRYLAEAVQRVVRLGTGRALDPEPREGPHL